MSTCLVVICKDIGEKINCPGDFVIVYMTDFPKLVVCPPPPPPSLLGTLRTNSHTHGSPEARTG